MPDQPVERPPAVKHRHLGNVGELAPLPRFLGNNQAFYKDVIYNAVYVQVDL